MNEKIECIGCRALMEDLDSTQRQKEVWRKDAVALTGRLGEIQKELDKVRITLAQYMGASVRGQKVITESNVGTIDDKTELQSKLDTAIKLIKISAEHLQYVENYNAKNLIEKHPHKDQDGDDYYYTETYNRFRIALDGLNSFLKRIDKL